jgi:uncharacterized glyoxalase superfamily protein PhnB
MYLTLRRVLAFIVTCWDSHGTLVTKHMQLFGATTAQFTLFEPKRVQKGSISYYEEIVGRGAEVSAEPRDQPYGIREFGVRDIDGVGIVFGQDIDHA